MTRISVTLSAALGLLACTRPVMDLGGVRPATPLFRGGDGCSSSSECASGLCLGGTCCSVPSCGTDPICQATQCDSSGACEYPTGSCGSDCSLGYLTPSTCSFGLCLPRNDAACPGSYACADATSCRSSCSQKSDCSDGYYCSDAGCFLQELPGNACTSNDDCKTGICGVAGIGNCCAGACKTGDPYGCGATGCDNLGACLYPNGQCISQICSGHTLTEPANCDGAGACAILTPATEDCSPYACDTNETCKTSCATVADCVHAFCSTAISVCCAFYPSNTIQVDGTKGVDQACCGSGTGTSACATIAYAAKLAVDTGVTPTTLTVANPPNGKDWTADSFPIVLGEGLILSAPGLYFSASGLDAGAPWQLILVSNPASDAGPLPTVIEGSADAPIHLGFDSQGNPTQTPTWPISPIDGDVIDLDHAKLNLLNVEIRTLGGTGIRVGRPSTTICPLCPTYQGGTLTLGNDGLGNSGTVWIGAPDAGGGERGISCWVPDGLVTDTGSTVAPSLWGQNNGLDVDITGGCSLSLTQWPRFGLDLNDAGGCDSLADVEGVSYSYGSYKGVGVPPDPAEGASSAVVSNATFQCTKYGLNVAGAFSGSNNLFRFNGEGAGLILEDADAIADGGRASLTNSTFRNNHVAIQAIGAIDINGGEISCSIGDYWGLAEGLHTLTSPGVPNVSAENIAWDRWDTDGGHTETWTCYFDADAGFIDYSACTCSNDPECPQGPVNLSPANGRRTPVLIESWPDSGPPDHIDDTNGSLAGDGCP